MKKVEYLSTSILHVTIATSSKEVDVAPHNRLGSCAKSIFSLTIIRVKVFLAGRGSIVISPEKHSLIKSHESINMWLITTLCSGFPRKLPGYFQFREVLYSGYKTWGLLKVENQRGLAQPLDLKGNDRASRCLKETRVPFRGRTHGLVIQHYGVLGKWR